MGAEAQVTAPSPPPFPCALLREASRWRREKKKKVREKETKKKKKGKKEASSTLQEMHFSNTNSFPTSSQRTPGHQLLPLPCRAPRLAPADLSSSHPLRPLSAADAASQLRWQRGRERGRRGEREGGREGGGPGAFRTNQRS